MSTTQLMTAEALWSMPEVRGRRYELANGELIEVPGAGGTHGRLALWVGALLLRFVGPRDLGVVSGDGTGYLLSRDPDNLRIPDVSFVSTARLPGGEVPEAFWPFAPDLAVEIVAPHDRAEDVQSKVREYLDAGTRMVWVLWPKRRSVTVYGPGGDIRDLGPEDELDRGDVLPGFRVRVAALLEAA